MLLPVLHLDEFLLFYAPASFNGEGHIVSLLSVGCMYEKWFHSISFEKISVLASYFIHRYIIIKKCHVPSGVISNYYGLWPFFNFIIRSVYERWFVFDVFSTFFFFFFFFQNAGFRVRMAPGQGHLCHIDTFLVGGDTFCGCLIAFLHTKPFRKRLTKRKEHRAPHSLVDRRVDS